MKKIYSSLFVLVAFFFGASAQQLDGYKICIDPGHGGHTSDDRQTFLDHGIVYWESEADLETAFHLDTMLKALGADVKLTRYANEDSDDIGLSARSTIANNFGADFFHSIHTNGFQGTANYTLMLFKGETNAPAFPAAKTMSDLMAPVLHDVLYTTTHYSRGDMTFLGYNLGVLKYADMPSTLSEGAFHDYPGEGLRLKSPHYLEQYAWGIAKSFLAFYNKNGLATGRLGGIISDDFNDEAVNAVKITVATVDSVCYTDENYNGFYAFDLNPGTYSITIEKDGYITKTVDNIQITGNTFTLKDIGITYFNEGKPRADFVVNGLPAGKEQQISFNASSSSDPDGTITKYEWDFGDGNSATGQTVNHTYTADDTYSVTLTVTDNEDKTGSITKDVEIKTEKPSDPRILSVINQGNDVKINWAANPESNAAYRLYVSNSDALNDFSVLVDENTLVSGTTEHTLTNLAPNANGYNFKISAVNAGGESGFSDTYSRVASAEEGAKKVLIVDGYDRLGSWGQATHPFAGTYMAGLRDAGNVIVSSAANEAVVIGSVTLTAYDLVVWFVGDESTSDETFSAQEQPIVKTYLQAGGNLLVTGSEIGWDLSVKGDANDKEFYANYLKAEFIGDGGSIGYVPATGITGTDFDGVTLTFDAVYDEDYPDEINAANGAENILEYANGKYSGAAYKGNFGSSSSEGGVVYVSFPIDQVADHTEISTFMDKLLNYFFAPSTSVEVIENSDKLKLYPIPAKGELMLNFNSYNGSHSKIAVFDFSGKKVLEAKLTSDNTTIDVSGLGAGFYILKLENNKMVFTKKFIKE